MDDNEGQYGLSRELEKVDRRIRIERLSDRELYALLWDDLLREETTIMPPDSGSACHLDVIGSGSEEDVQIGLKYYDDEKERAYWHESFPEDPIPAHEDPPYDRDRYLPKRDCC